MFGLSSQAQRSATTVTEMTALLISRGALLPAEKVTADAAIEKEVRGRKYRRRPSHSRNAKGIPRDGETMNNLNNSNYIDDSDPDENEVSSNIKDLEFSRLRIIKKKKMMNKAKDTSSLHVAAVSSDIEYEHAVQSRPDTIVNNPIRKQMGNRRERGKRREVHSTVDTIPPAMLVPALQPPVTRRKSKQGQQFHQDSNEGVVHPNIVDGNGNDN